MGPIRRPEKSVRSYQNTLRNLPEEHIYFAAEASNLASMCFVKQSDKARNILREVRLVNLNHIQDRTLTALSDPDQAALQGGRLEGGWHNWLRIMARRRVLFLWC